MNSYEWDVLSQAGQRLAQARRGERAAILQQVQQALGVSAQTAYRRLQEAGYDSGRGRRADAGRTAVQAEELRALAGMLLTSTNKKGQRMPLTTAVGLLRANGVVQAEVSDSTFARKLRDRRMQPEVLSTDTPAVQVASRHPNHVWQIDSTTGAYYYLPGGRLRWMPESEFYKNKVANLVKASQDLLTRYSVADHTTHAFKLRHYLGGETIANLLDFMVWAMVQQPGMPMHGVPFVLVMDKGGANKSAPVRNLCDAAKIDLIHHAAGNARATGSVEKTHDIVRMHFETRLRFADPSLVTLDRLNEEAQQWAAAYCATRRHTRHGMTRFEAWMHITPEQLRVATAEALREVAMRDPETPRVDNQRRISFRGQSYDLSQVPGAVPGLKVTVQLNVFRAPAIDVKHVDVDTGEITWHVVEPVKAGPWGFAEGSPVWGESTRTASHTEANRLASQLTREAYRTGAHLPTVEEAAAARKAHAQAYAGRIDPMADVAQTAVPAYLPRRGEAHLVAGAGRTVVTPKLSLYEAAKRLKEILGAAYSPQVYQHLEATYGGPAEGAEPGVPEGDLQALADRFGPDATDRAEGGQPPALRVVGGGQ